RAVGRATRARSGSAVTTSTTREGLANRCRRSPRHRLVRRPHAICRDAKAPGLRAPTRLRRPAAGERLANAQAETNEQLRNRLRLHLEAVALVELRQNLRVRPGHAAHVHELCEEQLEAGRRDDLEDPARLVARVPERVPLV